MDPRVEELRPADIGDGRCRAAPNGARLLLLELACALKGRLGRARRAARRDRRAARRRHVGARRPDAAGRTPRGATAWRSPRTAPRLERAARPLPTDDRLGAADAQRVRRRADAGPRRDVQRRRARRSARGAAVPRLVERRARLALLPPRARPRAVRDQGWLALAPHPVRLRGRCASPGGTSTATTSPTGTWSGRAKSPRVGGVPVRCFHFLTFDPLRARPAQLASPTSPPCGRRPPSDPVPRACAASTPSACSPPATRPRRRRWGRSSGWPTGPRWTPTCAPSTRGAAATRGREWGGAAEPVRRRRRRRVPALAGRAVGGPGRQRSPRSRATWSACTRAWTGCTGRSRRFPAPTRSAILRWLPEALERGDLDLPERWVPPPAPPAPDPALVELEDRYRDLLAALEAQRGSLSWRVTAPLRRAAALARRRH